MEPGVSHIGQRATIRVRVPGRGPSGGPALSDVVGEVLAVDATSVTVRRRSGEVTTVPRQAIVVFHPIVERPRRGR